MRLADRDLVRQGLPVVQSVARRIARRLGGTVQIDDLLGIGHVALIEAARSYDPARATFVAYAASKLKWAMLDGLRRETHGRSVKSARLLAVIASERYGERAEPDRDEPTTVEEDQASLKAFLNGQAAALALGLTAGLPDPDLFVPRAESPEEQLSRAQIVHAARAAIAALPDRERALIERHYFGGEAFDVIARDLGVSKSWASRLHDRAIDLLNLALRDPSDVEPEALET
ncbi:RNA polymerase sigma factor for flagellar operon [Minicystis rosea]|nr:RNA polymerase sigma factor for flagellar operon [Minicystis rosea]